MKFDVSIDGGQHTDYEGEQREYTWSVNLELPQHEGDRERVEREALEAAGRQHPVTSSTR